ncbi:lysozyme [Paenibacillus sp. HGF5]|uniref:lysozyme n=1 Tax=Paenibacillus sp. HGF5 TaxID=908341 RepID=UPI0002072653|nr:lysozyme [Paenibacillus sp. HGF5]EGG33442.1 putative lysozyme [Paenibacillus sp. HGF5]
MSEYIVDMTRPAKMNFRPATLAEELTQNIRTILTTPYGSAPFARSIGLDYEIVDEPLPILKARLSGVITMAIMEQEPRAEITEIQFHMNEQDKMNGRLLPIIKFRIAEGGDSG